MHAFPAQKPPELRIFVEELAMIGAVVCAEFLV